MLFLDRFFQTSCHFTESGGICPVLSLVVDSVSVGPLQLHSLHKAFGAHLPAQTHRHWRHVGSEPCLAYPLLFFLSQCGVNSQRTKSCWCLVHSVSVEACALASTYRHWGHVGSEPGLAHHPSSSSPPPYSSFYSWGEGQVWGAVGVIAVVTVEGHKAGSGVGGRFTIRWVLRKVRGQGYVACLVLYFTSISSEPWTVKQDPSLTIVLHF